VSYVLRQCFRSIPLPRVCGSHKNKGKRTRLYAPNRISVRSDKPPSSKGMLPSNLLTASIQHTHTHTHTHTPVNLFQEYSPDVTSLTSAQHEAVEWLAFIHKSYTPVDVESLDVTDTLLQLYVLAVVNYSSKRSVLDDPNWKVDPTWLPNDEVVGETPPGIVCSWAGVTCNDALQITRLELGMCFFCVGVGVCLSVGLAIFWTRLKPSSE
jgi:hypothetical protein